ncbi:MAG: Mfa1 fimbrilin C-terminal domain-containing protein [Muribaculaceae bacterium]|nr:Mfa1 fimbrilin C-terminal domain-containing protein [Muribaculaceae bacterium]
MKKNRIFGALSAAALLVAGACSNDMLDQNKNHGLLNTDETSGGVYLSIDFKMPTGSEGTRSETLDPADTEKNPNGFNSTGGTEVGSDAENFVSSALIVLAASEAKPEAQIEKYGFIVAGEVPSNRISTATSEGGKQYKATARLQKENLNTIYTTYGDGQVPEVYVFVFANPTTDLLNMFDGSNTDFGSASWIDATCEVLQSTDATQSKNVGIWGSNSFLMNNVKLTTRELPKKLLDWENFSSVENPFHLSSMNDGSGYEKIDNSKGNNRGAVLVERSVARFDFKDGSGTNENLYNVLMNTNKEGDFDNAKPIVDVQIQKMCLVNMCNSFYYLPRVSKNGMPNGENFELCGTELPWDRINGKYENGNYVVGPYASVFGGNAVMTGFKKYFNFPFFEENGSFNNESMSSTRWDVVKVSDVLKGTADNYVQPGVENAQPGQYRVWRYVTENVIPEDNAKQMNGVSTGVVFKGKLLGSKLADTENPGYYEESWNEGNIKNLANCLNGKTFTYNGEDHILQGNSHDDPILYYFSGHLYMGWRHIRQAAIQASVTINTAGAMEINRSNSLYKAVFGDGPIPTYTTKDDAGNEVVNYMVYVDPNETDPVKKNKIIDDPMWKSALDNTSGEDYQAYLKSANYAWSQWAAGDKEVGDDATGANTGEKLAAMRLAVTGAGISIYQSSMDDDYGAGYYCYYYYWNRHNDNGMNGSMGPMEFDVVRNNVYKLSIDKIARLGHPRIPENDPNNPTPDTPDESDEIYLDVRMEIVPWVVRLNSIVF